MHNDIFDLQAYFTRIGFRQTESAGIGTLNTLVKLHAACIAFENLTPWLGLPVNIELDSVAQKLLFDGRGGYCYEQNALMRAALQGIGFEVTGLAARVLWQRPADAEPAQSHMILGVVVDGTPYLVDVGFGGQSPTAPLRLDIAAPQKTPHGSYRITPMRERYLVEVQIENDWAPIYSFDLQPQLAGDYKVFNWFCATHPQSRFVTELVAAIAGPEGRYALLNDKLSHYPCNGLPQQRTLATVRELSDALQEVFLLQLPRHPDLEYRLEMTLQRAKTAQGDAS